MGLIDLGALEIDKDEGKKQGQFSAILFNQAWSVKKYNMGIFLQGGRGRKLRLHLKPKTSQTIGFVTLPSNNNLLVYSRS